MAGSYVIDPVSTGRILIYDSDIRRASSIKELLRERGYLCKLAETPSICLQMIKTKDYNLLFIGDLDDNLKLFRIVDEAKKAGVELHHYGLEDAGDVSVMDLIRKIENLIIMSQHAAN